MIVAGFGFRDSATVESLRDALGDARPDLCVTLASKSSHAAFLLLDPPRQGVALDVAIRQPTPTSADASVASYGVGSVAEACALAAAGPGARLLAPRRISRDKRATCALAIGEGA